MKRVTIIAGHYGSGKTNIAVNLAHLLRQQSEKVIVADLDIVNPYFRTEDSRSELEAEGIRMICSGYANSNVDLPSMPDDLNVIIDDRENQVIIDVGGDDRGALAMGRLSGPIRQENDYDMLLVINRFRPLTPDADSCVEVMKEIEFAGRIPFTGIIHNSNLGRDTTKETILSSLSFAKEVSEKTGLPILWTTVEESLVPELKESGAEIPGLLGLHLQKRPV